MNDVKQVVERRRGEATRLLQETIRIPSVSGEEADISEYLKDWCVARGWSVETQPLVGSELDRQGELAQEPNPAARWNVVARPRPRTTKPLLIINGHVDVVPAGDEAAWSTPPFAGRLKDGSVYGRGAVDTKGGIVSALIAVDAIVELGADWAVDVELHFVVGEERSGIGTRLALAEGDRPNAVVVLEATGGQVVTASTGVVAFEVQVTGLTAHSSRPGEGRDAFAHMLRIRDALKAREEIRRAEFSSDDFSDVSDPLPFVIGVAQAGSFPNSVPQRSTMAGRFGLSLNANRVVELDTLSDLVWRIDREAGWPDPSRVTILHSLSAWHTDRSEMLVSAFRRAAGALGRDVELAVLTTGSDAGYYGELDIPTVIFGPGDLAIAHGPNELIKVDAVIDAASLLAETILAFDYSPLKGGDSRRLTRNTGGNP